MEYASDSFEMVNDSKNCLVVKRVTPTLWGVYVIGSRKKGHYRHDVNVIWGLKVLFFGRVGRNYTGNVSELQSGGFGLSARHKSVEGCFVEEVIFIEGGDGPKITGFVRLGRD